MASPLRLVTWNLLHGGMKRHHLAVEVLRELKPDVAVLTEYRLASLPMKEELGAAGMRSVLDSAPEGNNNGVLIASRIPMTRGPIEAPASVKGRWVHALLDNGLELGACHVPDHRRGGSHKQEMWSWLLGVAESGRDRSMVLLGDLNTRTNKLDSEGYRFTCARDFEQLGESGWRDAFARSMVRNEPSAGGAPPETVFGSTMHSSRRH